VQREGEVIHVIADDLQDLSHELRAVGGLDFPHRTGPGDGAKNGGYDARDKNKDPVKARDLFHPPFRHGPRAQPEEPAPFKAPEEPAPVKARDLFYPAFRPKPYEPGEDTPAIKVKSRDFH
jgi:hypothetical protein